MNGPESPGIRLGRGSQSCMDPRLVHSRIDRERAAYALCQEVGI